MGNIDQSEIMKLAGEGKAEDLHRLLRAKCFEPNGGLYYFTKVVLGYKELVPHFHLDLCNSIQNTIHLMKRGYLQPRGHFKSTIGKSYMLWRLAGGGSPYLDQFLKLEPQELVDYYQSYPEHDPRNLRILVIGESDTVAQKDLKDPKWHCENNQMFRWLFPELIPPNFNATKWTDDEIILPRTKSFDESTITCDGVGAKRTGFHWDLLIYEDIFGEKASKSEAVAEEVKNWFQFAAGMLNDPRSSEELMLGTRWKDGEADIYGWTMSNMPGRFHWVCRSVYNDDGRIGFPERFPQEVLDAILEREGVYKFSCNYLNDPTPPEGGDFSESDLCYYRIDTEDPNGHAIVPEDGSPKVYLKHLARSSFYDPTSGGIANASCENGICVVGGDHLKRIFFLEAWSKNCSMGEAIEMWHKLNDKFQCFRNQWEAVGAHKEVGTMIAERQLWPECLLCKKAGQANVKHRRLNPESWLPPGGKGAVSKDDRIRDYLQLPVEEHRVYLRRDRPHLRTQILSFPHYHLKDLVDAAASAVHNCQFPLAPEEIEARATEQETIKTAARSCIATKYEYGGYV